MAKTFTVAHGGIRIKVKLCETVRDVHLAYQASRNGATRRDGLEVNAFFCPTRSITAKHIGHIVLPLDGGDLNEFVPHEVSHAVIHAHQGVLPHDDEDTASAIGVLCSRIFKRLNQIKAGAV